MQSIAFIPRCGSIRGALRISLGVAEKIVGVGETGGSGAMGHRADAELGIRNGEFGLQTATLQKAESKAWDI